MLKFFRKLSAGTFCKLALIILPILLAVNCGQFFPSASTLVGISISPSNQTIQFGGTQQFTATGTFGDGSTQSITSSVTWTSSSTNIATINSSGLATAGNSAGSTNITASKGNQSAVTTLTVSSSSGGSITLSCALCTSNGSGSFSAPITDGSVTFTATQNNQTVSPQWSSTNASLPINSSTGVVTFIAAGTTTITANVNGATGTATLTVQ